MIDKQSEEKLRQLFQNRSDCYADTEDDSVVMAMSENGFIEVMNEALSIFGVSNSVVCTQCNGKGELPYSSVFIRCEKCKGTGKL